MTVPQCRHSESKPLTLLERRTLHLAARKGGVVVVARRKRKDDRAVTTATANRVVLAGWATISSDVLLITKAGRAKLKEPIPDDAPLFLARGGGARYETLRGGRQRAIVDDDAEASTDPTDRGYTTSPTRAIDDLETMDPTLVHNDWRMRAEAHRRRDREDANAARLSGLTHPDERLRELLRMAAERGVDVREEVRYIKHGLRVLERKLTGESEAA